MMKSTNAAIFSALDGYCSNRGDPIKNATTPRWIAGPTPAEKAFFTNAKLVFSLSFTLTRRAALMEYLDQSYFCLIGFDEAVQFGPLEQIAITGGIFSTVIGELSPKPIKSTSEIRNVVEAQDQAAGGTSYKGHPLVLMASLFPTVSVFALPRVSESEAYRIFFRFCAMECENGDFWIEQPLAHALIELCDLDSIRVPYQTLCRSIFDADPAGLFLGLYRCIEALYAFRSSRKIAKDFDLDIEWTEISIVLESSLGWRAAEASSLNSLLSFCDEELFLNLFSALGIAPAVGLPSLKDSAGKQIYKLRNALVHYRPVHHRAEYAHINWNPLCITLTAMVRSVYEGILSAAHLVDEIPA